MEFCKQRGELATARTNELWQESKTLYFTSAGVSGEQAWEDFGDKMYDICNRY